MTSARRPVVLKFGGGALADLPHLIERVREVRDGGHPVVLVVSARRGVTDRLRVILATPRRSRAHGRAVEEITSLHPGLPPMGLRALARLKRLVLRVEMGAPIDLALADRLLSQGERLAVHWLSVQLREVGIPAISVEADGLGLVTDNDYGAARILLRRSAPKVRAGLRRYLRKGEVPVVTGYFGRSLEGRVATLGRGGSDYSATALAAILGAERVELFKRGVAVLSADPREVPDALLVNSLSYREADELAQFGARILHPLTIEPAEHSRLPILVRSLVPPGSVTLIGVSRPAHPNRILTRRSGLALLTTHVPGGRDRPGPLSEIGAALLGGDVNILAAWTSAADVHVVVDRSRGSRAAGVLGTIPGVARPEETGVALVTAIGEGVAGEFHRTPVKVLRKSRGIIATPRSLTFVVPDATGLATLRTLHEAFVAPRRRRTPTPTRKRSGSPPRRQR